jgi:hypothetical protein
MYCHRDRRVHLPSQDEGRFFDPFAIRMARHSDADIVEEVR